MALALLPANNQNVVLNIIGSGLLNLWKTHDHHENLNWLAGSKEQSPEYSSTIPERLDFEMPQRPPPFRNHLDTHTEGWWHKARLSCSFKMLLIANVNVNVKQSKLELSSGYLLFPSRLNGLYCVIRPHQTSRQLLAQVFMTQVQFDCVSTNKVYCCREQLSPRYCSFRYLTSWTQTPKLKIRKP